MYPRRKTFAYERQLSPFSANCRRSGVRSAIAIPVPLPAGNPQDLKFGTRR